MKYILKIMLVISLLLFSLACAEATKILFSFVSSEATKNPDVKADVEKALTQAGLKNISISQDRDKGVITLTGDVRTDADKQRAESEARSVALLYVISNQIGVRPPGSERAAEKVDSSLDKAIEKNFEALLVANRLDKGIDYSASNGVLTLNGRVANINERQEIGQLAAIVPNVKQVVNELQIEGVKGTSKAS